MDLTWDTIQIFLESAIEARVSQKARSPGQIVDQFRKYHSVDQLPLEWQKKRHSFIARQLVQYKHHPTYRRFLALIMWGYLPDIFPPKLV